MISDQIK